MAEDRNLLERAQDYLVSGDFDRDARYVLGPHLSKGLLGLAQLIGPGADIKAGVDEAKRIVPYLRKGNVPGALAATGLAAATPLFMVSPGSAKEVREVSEELIPQRLFHGTSNPDIKKLKSSKEGVLGEGVYLTPNPEYASTYATGDTANVIPVTANIKNPLVVQSTGAEPSTDVLKALGVPEDKAFSITEKAFDDKLNITKEISTRARKKGYDAVVFKNKDGDIQEIVAYKPDNISSAIGKKAEEATPENIPVMPVNQAKLEEKGFEFKPGGEYVNPKTNEILTGRNVGFANIKIVPEMGVNGDRPMASFNVNNLDVPEVGTVGKGNTDIKVNLIKPTSTGGNGRGWFWTDLKDKNFKDVNTLVSVHVPSKKKHYYTMETDFSKGANLKTYPKSRDEPRLKPTAKGTLDFEDQIGTIQMGKDKEGKPVMHPVYRKIVAKYAGGQIKKGGSIVERNPNNYSPKAI